MCGRNLGHDGVISQGLYTGNRLIRNAHITLLWSFDQVFYNPGTFDDFQSPVRDNCHDSQIIINVLIYDICMHAPGAVVRSKRGYEGDAPLNFKWFKLYRKALQS